MGESILLSGYVHSLKDKVDFLSHRESYSGVTKVTPLETHMSWVFVTDRYVYKLKKPVIYSFLDFSTLDYRHHFCLEEINVNQFLAKDIYISVLPLKSFRGKLKLGGPGDTVDWLVKMKRLPENLMLHNAIKNHSVTEEAVLKVAGNLADFYVASPGIIVNADQFMKEMLVDIENHCTNLLRAEFKCDHSRIITIGTNLIYFVMKNGKLFNQRFEQERVIDAHGDLRPEHVCIDPVSVIIDRLEFSHKLRTMDMAEELSFLAMECEILGDDITGQVFLDVYQKKSDDHIPEILVHFYKARRAFLRAKLSIFHLLEERYQSESIKWQQRCDMYLATAYKYSQLL